jgi:hypothetical protein
MTPHYDALDAAIQDPGIRRFWAYWRAKSAAGALPARRALDPLDFPYVLGKVVLIEARRGSGETPDWRFRYRLVGTEVVARDGYDLTNRTLEDLPDPEYREQIRHTWTSVCETTEPFHGFRDRMMDGRTRRYEVIVLPLAENGHHVDMLISVQNNLHAERADRRAAFGLSGPR